MITFPDFKQQLLDYLQQEKNLYEEDIKSNNELPDAQKVDVGLLIRSVTIDEEDGFEYVLTTSENETKLRSGDRVTLVDSCKKKVLCRIIENGTSKIIVEASQHLKVHETYRLEVSEFIYLDPLIKLIEKIDLGLPGSDFLEILAGIRDPKKDGLLPIDTKEPFPDSMNNSQLIACTEVVKCPSIFCIQGPPGTGKTDVLSTIAKLFASDECQVLVLSKTHQAVNNALNKIASKMSGGHVFKIGEELKSQDLTEKVLNFQTYAGYIKDRKHRKKCESDIVGMTLRSATVNLGLMHKGFLPYLVLVDEAGQIPLVEAACIGTFGAATIVFIGDEKQMLPIYHEKQVDDPLSISIFEYLCQLYPDFKQMLNVTYRMNEEITHYVSSQYYEGKLIASDYSKDRHLDLSPSNEDPRINELLTSKRSIIDINVSTGIYKDENEEEALFIANLIKEAIESGMSPNDIAVITPFRRQVRCIREHIINSLACELPLVDTVERLQGQDVDLIIISCATTDRRFYLQNKEFLTNSNRWNVMISRAKKKVIIIGAFV